MTWYLVTTSAMALAGILVYLYYWKKGQFEEIEDVKYQLFREDEASVIQAQKTDCKEES